MLSANEPGTSAGVVRCLTVYQEPEFSLMSSVRNAPSLTSDRSVLLIGRLPSLCLCDKNAGTTRKKDTLTDGSGGVNIREEAVYGRLLVPVMAQLGGMPIMNRIIKATPLPDHTLLLFFESGHIKLLDMKPYIDKGGVWSEIVDWQVFSQVKVQEDLGGLVWPDEIDFCPETAFKVSKPAPTALLRDLVITYSPTSEKDTGTGQMVS